MADRTSEDDAAGRFSRLRLTRATTRLVVIFERFWPRILPLMLVIGLFLAVSWAGLFRLMPDVARLVVVALFGLAALAALWPLRSARWPSAAEIDRRIERANALDHTPVGAQGDRLSVAGDPFADALWRAHQRRMANRLTRVSGDLPRTDVPDRDPWGLRAAVALLLVTAFAFAYGPLGGSVSDAFRPAPGAVPVPPRIDAWVTPPTYTGRPPVFLTAEANRGQALFTVPEGSEVTLRVIGGAGDETLSYAAAGQSRPIAPEHAAAEANQPAPTAPGAGPRHFKTVLDANGALALASGETELARWTFAVTPDAPPVIAFAGEPKRAVNGTLELAYTITDDYGAASAKVEFETVEPQPSDARPLYPKPDMPLVLPRRAARDGAAKTSRDLTDHVWAGVEVTATLSATDAAGQSAASEAKTFRLPERPFTNPLARAVVEQRRLLGLDANAKPRVLDLIEAVLLRPEDTIPVLQHFLAIKSAETRLRMARTDAQLREVVDYMWEIALGIENGDLSAAERRLRQAQEALKNALENGATDEEIEKLMAEMREAMREFMREFAERAMQNQNGAQAPENSRELRQSDIERMMDQIEEMAKSGARQQAQDMLSQLQEMMNNLQAGRPQQGQQNGQQSEMRQQMDKLGELMRRQQQMMNETHRLDQMQRGRGERERGGQQPGEGEQGQGGEGQQGQGGMSPEELAEALRQLQEGQGQLAQELSELMQSLEGMGIKPGEGFGEAGEAMDGAGRALGQAQGEEAVGEQARALDALRRGAQDMMGQMQAQQGEQGGSEEGGRQQSSDRDPLGRPRATTGPDFGESVKVPDEIDVQRARRILEEIRRRLGNALSPEIEKDYLERLLQMR